MAMRVIRRTGRWEHTLVKDLMTRDVVAADPRLSLVDAATRMRAERVSALTILDDGAIVGILTERDLMRAIADGRDPAEAHVSQYMSSEPHTIEAGADAGRAASMMAVHRVRHLPVTAGGRLVGVLSARDLLAVHSRASRLPIGEHW